MTDRLIANHYMKEAIDILGNGMCTLAMVAGNEIDLSEAEYVRLHALWIETGRKAKDSIDRGLALLTKATVRAEEA